MSASQSEKAYREIRHRLLSNNIAAGSRLIEQTWAEQLQVNRGDIRQALARLLAEGAVEKGRKGGFFARIYSAEDIGYIAETRLILETAAVSRIVQRASEDELRQLGDIADHMSLMADNGYDMGFSEADVRFHQLLIDLAHNPALSRAYLHANLPLQATQYSSVEELTRNLQRNAREHHDIIKALREKDADRAAAILVQGMAGSLKALP